MLNHDSDIPLYKQLHGLLEAAIRSGSYASGEKLPSESAMCQDYGVSRITVRQALAQLEHQGLVTTIKRKGTYVKPPVISQNLIKIVNFGKTLQQKGLEGYTEVLSYNTQVQDSQMEALLRAEELGPLCCMELIGYAEGGPIVYYRSFLRRDMGERMHRSAQMLARRGVAFSTFDLYHDAGVSIGEIDQTIGAINADRKLAGILSLPKGAALVVLKSVVYDEQKRPVEHKIGYYRSDKYSFSLKREM